MRDIMKNSVTMLVIAGFGLGLAACGGGGSTADMATESPPRPALGTAIATPDIVRGTLSGDPYETEQLLGDNGPDSVRKNDQENDTHTLAIDGGTVTEDPADTNMANNFTMGAAPATIAGFTGSTHDRTLADIDEVHTVVVYTDKDGPSDTDYVDFGYWFLDYAADDHIGYFTHTFARGSNPSGNVSQVSGSATYRGAATGLFVKDDPAGASSGQFTAAAVLRANFAGATDPFTISGTVSDFKDASGNAIDPAWQVDLMQTDIIARTGQTAGRGSTTGDGAWRAEFHGSTGSGSDQPGTVAGTFDAHLSNGHVGGAFAAHK